MTDGEHSLLRQTLRCGFLGNSQQRARKSLGELMGEGALLSGVLMGEESLSWVHRRPWLRKERLVFCGITGNWEAQGGHGQEH